MSGIGARLLRIRHKWQLSLREVEQRTRWLAEEKGNQSYMVSASWLYRLEREEHELSVNKLLALAEIYNVSPGQLLRCMNPGSGPNLVSRQLSPESASMKPCEGSLEAQLSLADQHVPSRPADNETGLLPAENGQSGTPYRRGIIGKYDLTLQPMIPAGSMVQIDTQQRAISTQKNWTNEFRRPIYFLMTRDGYVCGWCELDENSHWLTLIPHSLSPAPIRRWRYRTEIESIGRVIRVAMPLII